MTTTLRPTDLHVGDIAEGTCYETYGRIVQIVFYGFQQEHCTFVFAHGVEVPLDCRCPIGGTWA